MIPIKDSAGLQDPKETKQKKFCVQVQRLYSKDQQPICSVLWQSWLQNVHPFPCWVAIRGVASEKPTDDVSNQESSTVKLRMPPITSFRTTKGLSPGQPKDTCWGWKHLPPAPGASTSLWDREGGPGFLLEYRASTENSEIGSTCHLLSLNAVDPSKIHGPHSA